MQRGPIFGGQNLVHFLEPGGELDVMGGDNVVVAGKIRPPMAARSSCASQVVRARTRISIPSTHFVPLFDANSAKSAGLSAMSRRVVRNSTNALLPKKRSKCA